MHFYLHGLSTTYSWSSIFFLILSKNIIFINAAIIKWDFEKNDEHIRERTVLNNKDYRWENATVPYTFTYKTNSTFQNIVLKAMSTIEDFSCVKFKRRENEHNFIKIDLCKECYSDVGRLGIGEQDLCLSDECLNETIITHELLHVLGFVHEHTRCDRDNYVTINYENIEIKHIKSNFGKTECDKLTSFHYSYDYHSIMHYRGDEFAIDPSIKTILPKYVDDINKTQELGNSVMSNGDIYKLNRAYNC